ncbi:immunoglobulin domain-containing protein [Fibrobacterota bacterium]
MKSLVLSASARSLGAIWLAAMLAATIHPALAETVLDVNFNSDAEGFSYVDDAFRGTSNSAYASGAYLSSGGFSGGGLQVQMGGLDNNTINGMSGGWSTTFSLAEAGQIQLTFRYNLTLAENYEADEYAEGLAQIDGALLGTGGNDYVNRLAGDGNGGSPTTSGWQLVTISAGLLSAGSHTLTIGAHNNKKTYADEQSEILIDDVSVEAGEITITNGLLREAWTGVAGSLISDLTGSPDYPDNPDVSDFLTIFETPTNWADNYGTRIRGYVHPPVSGNYSFWIASDDASALYLSTSADPAGAVSICNVDTWTSPREWTKFASQHSSSISLIGGQKYYIEALMKEGGGLDNFAVGWDGPGITGDAERPIPNARLTPWTGVTADPPQITSHPAAQAVTEGQTASFSVTATGEGTLTYQWRKNGSDISGATSAGYTTSATSMADNGAQYDVIVSNAGGSVTSNAAVLTVSPLPPVITGHPSSQTVNEGQTATFSVTATSSVSMTYQWRKNGSIITGATSAGYTTPAVSLSDNGAQYDVVVANSAGPVTSNAAVLTVNALPPVITIQPASQTVSEGQTASFSVAATSSSSMTYQWRKNGTPLSGATSAGYTTPATTLSDNGAQYDVIVTNSAGSTTSSAAVLTVNPLPPVISAHPSSQTVNEGQTASFSVTASGSGTLTYQWRKDGTPISGATSAGYTTPATSIADNGAQYEVIVSNAGGSVTSNAATLTVSPLPPVITSHPSSQSVNEGQTATFNVTATSSISMTYQWRKNGSNITGATSASYTTPANTLSDNGAQYDVVVTNSAGPVTSNTATLTVNALPPVITAHPVSQTVIEGQTATFNVTATSSTSMTYQWRKNGSNIAGATSAGYTTPATTLSDNGAQFDVIVTNSAGPVTSNPAILTVNPLPPVISVHPSSKSVNEGQTVTFNVTASGSGTLTYQWRKDGTPISGATSAGYTTPAVSMSDNGDQYDVIVSNAGGSVTSDAAVLTVNPLPPVVTSHPVSQTVPEGQTASFSVTATSSVPMTYQWRKNGSAITGATSASYTTPAVSLSDNGAQYDVVVSNSAGPVTSNPAILTVNALPPVITTHPVSQTIIEGQTVTFSVIASSGEPVTYQWRKDGGNISGAASASYTIPPAAFGDNGARFDVVVSNSGGNTISDPAFLTVSPLPPMITSHPAGQIVNDGQTASFSVTAASSAPMTYQWRRDGGNISGATSSSYLTPPLSLADNGAQFDVIVANSGGSTTSNPAAVTVNAIPPVITSQPINQTVLEGSAATFSVAASGSQPLYYQWSKNGTEIPGAQSESYTTPAVFMADNGAQFTVTVSNAADNVTSNPAILTVTQTTPQNKKLAISGELADESGNPVGYPDPVDMDVTVRLYNDKDAGSVLYTETFLAADGQAVTVEDGLFVARLGEGTTSENLQSVIAGNAGLWVEITIDDGTPDVLLPRTPLTASAYSLGGSPLFAPAAPQVVYGNSDPETMEGDFAIGTYYVNQENNSTWLKVSRGWQLID